MKSIGRREVLKLAGLTAVAAPVQERAGLRQAAPLGQTPRQPVRRQASPPAKLTGLHLVAPSTVRSGEEFTIGVKLLTEPYAVPRNCFTANYPTVSSSTNVSPRGIAYMDNVPAKWEGALTLSASSGYSGPGEVLLGKGHGPYAHDQRPISRIGPCRFDRPGIHFVTLTDPGSGVTARSNAICVSDGRERRSQKKPTPGFSHPVCTIDAGEERVFWGDIHGHTILTDGIRSPEEVYFFARDEAFLDICALSDHTEFYLTDRQWDYLTSVTNDFYQPGRFVTLVAQEWTNFRLGHRNIYHLGASAPRIRATDPYWGQLKNLFEFARQYGALVVPHHPAAAAMGVDWSLEHDPEVERLVEIYSCWGSSERSTAAGNPRSINPGIGGEKAGSFVVDALKLGRRYGIIASGDVHDGRMGDALHSYQAEPENYKFTQPGGLVGIWAKDLSREAVFNALWNRNVYGTTGARIILQFSIQGQRMGSVVKSGGELVVEVRAASDLPISRLDLVRNGEDSLSEAPSLTEFVWQSRVVPATASDCYYVRLSRSDGQMAWSSPIWVEAS